MAAYIIVEIEVTDPVGYEEYKKLAAASVESHGGKYIVRGGAAEKLEGDWDPKRMVILQFENMQRAKEWLNCDEYREPRCTKHEIRSTWESLVSTPAGDAVCPQQAPQDKLSLLVVARTNPRHKLRAS